jgi:thioredoxin-like negative regulator of GroEL
MEPVVDRLEQEFEGEIEFRLLNFDHDEDAAAEGDRFGVRYVPTFVFLDSDGEQVDLVVGALPEADLRSKLESILD